MFWFLLYIKGYFFLLILCYEEIFLFSRTETRTEPHFRTGRTPHSLSKTTTQYGI